MNHSKIPSFQFGLIHTIYFPYFVRPPSLMFSLHAIHSLVSPCNVTFEWLSESYCSKLTPVGILDREKTSVAVFLYVFRLRFTASLLSMYLMQKQSLFPKSVIIQSSLSGYLLFKFVWKHSSLTLKLFIREVILSNRIPSFYDVFFLIICIFLFFMHMLLQYRSFLTKKPLFKQLYTNWATT